MATVRFLYKQVRGIYQPVIPVGIKFPSRWFPLDVYVDSGAEYTVIEAEIAQSIGFDYRQGNRVYLQVGSGGLISVYLNDLEVQLGSVQLTCRVGFSEQLKINYNVLGKADIFEAFKICFSQKQRLITFESIE